MDAAASELKIRTHVREELLDITDDAAVRLPPGVHARPDGLPPDRRRAAAAEAVRRARRDAVGRLDLRQPGVHRVVPPRNGGDLPQPQAGADPVDDPLLSTTYGGFDLRTVSRRDPEAAPAGGPLEATVRKVPPELEGIKFGDRWGVVFSPYDLSCALEKHDSLECRGYTREDAARIGLNVVLYSLQQ